jgi:hypothetical protein
MRVRLQLLDTLLERLADGFDFDSLCVSRRPKLLECGGKLLGLGMRGTGIGSLRVMCGSQLFDLSLQLICPEGCSPGLGSVRVACGSKFLDRSVEMLGFRVRAVRMGRVSVACGLKLVDRSLKLLGLRIRGARIRGVRIARPSKLLACRLELLGHGVSGIDLCAELIAPRLALVSRRIHLCLQLIDPQRERAMGMLRFSALRLARGTHLVQRCL